jgi:hypothetical protein
MAEQMVAKEVSVNLALGGKYIGKILASSTQGQWFESCFHHWPWHRKWQKKMDLEIWPEVVAQRLIVLRSRIRVQLLQMELGDKMTEKEVSLNSFKMQKLTNFSTKVACWTNHLLYCFFPLSSPLSAF